MTTVKYSLDHIDVTVWDKWTCSLIEVNGKLMGQDHAADDLRRFLRPHIGLCSVHILSNDEVHPGSSRFLHLSEVEGSTEHTVIWFLVWLDSVIL